MKKIRIASLAVLAGIVVVGFFQISRSHCQIPCGIYDDRLRYDLLQEHVTTIEKSMKQIAELSASETIDYNQLVRWVTNKDDHADQLMHIVMHYFLAQRIAPVATDKDAEHDKYLTQLTLMHQMIVYAMKCKQTTDLGNTERLKALISESRKLYFAEHDHEH